MIEAIGRVLGLGGIGVLKSDLRIVHVSAADVDGLPAALLLLES